MDRALGLFLLLVVLVPHDSNVVVYVQDIVRIILSLKRISSFLYLFFFFFRPAALVCFAFPISLHQPQDKKNEQQKNIFSALNAVRNMRVV